MAEVVAFRNNALPYPVYGCPYTVVAPLLDADGDPVTGATCDSEVSKNGDTGVDCTNEGAEIPFTTATNKGMYYLTLTAAEMMADIVAVTIYSATSKATPIVLYPRKLVTLASGTSAGGAVGYITLAASTVDFDGQFNGCLCVATIDTNVEARILQACTTADQQCTVTPNWNVAPDADDTYVVYLPEGVQIPQANVTQWKDATAPAMTGDSYAVVAHADYGNAKLVRSTTPANAFTVSANGEGNADLTFIHGSALTETSPGYLAAAFIKLFDVATPLLVASGVMRGTDGANTTKTGYTLTNLSDANAAKLEDILDGTGGTGLTLNSIVITGAATGISVTGTTAGISISGGTTGIGLDINGGSSSGVALAIDSTSGAAIDITAAAGIAVDIDGTHATRGALDITNNHGSTGSGLYISGKAYGLYSVGGTYGGYYYSASGAGLAAIGAGGSGLKVWGTTAGLEATGITNGDGIKAALAGTGKDIRGDVTGNITGNLSGNVGGNVVGTVASVVAKTGYSLVSTGLNLVLVDTLTLPVALQLMAASTAGKISGAGTGTETVVGIDGSTTRITATVDASGNRTGMSYP